MRYAKAKLAALLSASTLVLSAAPAWAQETAAPEEAQTGQEVTSYDEIVVTARRREETLQTVPVSVTAFSTQGLETRGITELRDLTVSTPGLIFTSSGSAQNTNITLRAQTKAVVGVGLPSVITYLNDVPLPSYGSSIPTFDLGSVQVLKGPQGTFFGRNTTGGAVLTYTVAPSYNFEGYVKGTYGSYNWAEIEGAVNVPIVQDRVAARLAVNQVTRDGYTKNLSRPGEDFDARDDWAIRASLLIEPFDGLKNTTVYDWMTSNTPGSGSTILSVYSNQGAARLVPALRPFFDCSAAAAAIPGICDPANPTPRNDVDLAFERQQRVGVRAAFTDVPTDTNMTVQGLSNTTTLDVGSVSIKNIFGYRRTELSLNGNTDASDFPLINAFNRINDKQISDELQFSGTLFGDRVNWLIGGFYLEGTPGGISGLALSAFSPAPAANYTFNHSYYRDTSKAVFGQLNIKLVEGLTLNGGYRRTWDQQSVCAIANPWGQPRISEDACQASATAFKYTVKSNAPTWTVGLDWQASDDVFLYATSRQGYRGGGINTPYFGGNLVPYQTFAPEKINDIEVGAKVDWNVGDVRGRFNIAGFRGIYQNIQRQLSTPTGINFDGDGIDANDPPTVIVNGGKARIQGIELAGVITPFQGLDIDFSGAWTDAKFTSFAVPPLFNSVNPGVTQAFTATPKFSGGLGATYTHDLGASGKLAFHADYYHSASIYYASILQPAFDVVNARIDWRRVGGSNVDLGLFVRNLTDVEYVASGNLSSPGTTMLTGSYNPPRMFGGQVKFSFGQ
jgi:iron complex outermembrane receptor protein